MVIYAHVTMLELETAHALHPANNDCPECKAALMEVAEGKACPRTLAIKGDPVSVEFG